MLKSYKYRIYPNEKQERLLLKTFGSCRFIYNWALGFRTKRYQQYGENISRFELAKMLVFFKTTEERKWLSEVNSQSLQSELRHLDSAFTNFFRKNSKYPTFKKKGKKQSFECPQNVDINFESKRIKIPKLGLIKYMDKKVFEGKIKTCTVSLRNSRYYISILVDNNLPLPKKCKIEEVSSIGIDVGLTHFATLSDGTKIENPRILRKYEDKLKIYQRRLSRKTKFGQNWKKQKSRIGSIHQKIADTRSDFLNKLSTNIVKNHDTIFAEDLNIQGMLKNHCLAKSISDVAWSEFFRQLLYKSAWSGKNLIEIGRFEPSSRLSDCGEINHDLKLSDRTWVCKSCGKTYDRDIQAAKNIKKMGLMKGKYKTGQGMPVGPVEISHE